MIVGLDMGGTHIDAVIIKNSKIINTVKKPNNPDNPFHALWQTLETLLSGYDKSEIKRINLSTTVSTNAIVENRVSTVGMIIQRGPGLYNNFLACGDDNLFISGSIDHRGEIVKNFNPKELEEGIESFRKNNIQNCAIVTKFSTRNPQQEILIKNMVDKKFSFTTMGHTLSGKLNFPRRVFTSYLNAAVYDSFNNFSKNIRKSFEKEGINPPIFILKADGGTLSLSAAGEKPVETILSGPSASFMGMSALFDTEEDALLLDIGGTTTDIFFLADGVALFEPLGIKIGPYKTLVRSIYSVSIGLGGDSRIVIENKKIKIGPIREGSPYAFGGPKPTPTDAMISLGLMKDGDMNKANEAMGLLAKDLGLSIRDVSRLVLATMGDMIKEKVDELLYDINSKPVYTVKELLHGKEVKPKVIQVIGGPAKVLSPILSEKFHLPCNYPQNHHVANAVGAALAKPTTEINMLADTSKGILSVPELGIYEKISRNYTLDNARDRAIKLLKDNAEAIGANKEDIGTERTEESSFNMVRGFSTSGQNIRIKAQIKPGLLYKLKGGIENDES